MGRVTLLTSKLLPLAKKCSLELHCSYVDIRYAGASSVYQDIKYLANSSTINNVLINYIVLVPRFCLGWRRYGWLLKSLIAVVVKSVCIEANGNVSLRIIAREPGISGEPRPQSFVDFAH